MVMNNRMNEWLMLRKAELGKDPQLNPIAFFEWLKNNP